MIPAIASVLTMLIVVVIGAVAILVRACGDRYRRSAVEKAFDAARAQDDFPAPEELFDAFAVAVDGSSEAELKRLTRQLSVFNQRLERMRRQAKEGMKK